MRLQSDPDVVQFCMLRAKFRGLATLLSTDPHCCHIVKGIRDNRTVVQLGDRAYASKIKGLSQQQSKGNMHQYVNSDDAWRGYNNQFREFD